jgi:RNA 2',3'-cyclic 3'-phosphodiesterase
MRLFIAVDIPPELKARLADLQTSACIPAFRHVRPENIHLTVKFLGEVPDTRVPKVIAALADVPFEHLALSTTKLGTFRGVFWLGIKLTSELAQLQKHLERACLPFAPKEFRQFKPHLTIARFPVLTPNEELALQALVRQRIDVKWKARAFILYRSTLTAGGPVYDAVAAFPRSSS